MNIGECMKYYRIFKGMTQKQVGDGICTPGHISKIESGHLYVTKDKMDLFNQRLGINIEQERKAYQKLQTELMVWHDAMIKQVNGKVELLKETIEQNPLVKIETLNGTYKLLKARYLMGKGDVQEAAFLLNQLSTKRLSYYMREYDHHLYYHIKGIFELLKGEAAAAIDVLRKIDPKVYTNFEYHYHMALAHQQLGQHELAILHGEMSLHHFKDTFNFTRCIDAAMVQLISEHNNGEGHLERLEVKHIELIQHCEDLHDHRRKAIIFMNLGNVYRDVMNERKAKEAFQTADSLLKHDAPKPHGEDGLLLNHVCRAKKELLPV
jgi:HTH-type transcriptional regulator, quorum sensing regulator NprR